MNKEKLVAIETQLIEMLKQLERFRKGDIAGKELLAHYERLHSDLEKEINFVLKMLEKKNA